MRTMTSPWYPFDEVTADQCWHCREEFTASELLRVVDSVSPKLVHDRKPCADAMSQKMRTVPR